MFWQKPKGFIKVLLTAGAVVPTLAVVQKGLFAHRWNILNYRATVIVNLLCYSFAVRTGMVFTRQREINMNLRVICLHIIIITSSNSRSFEVKSVVGIGVHPFCMFCCGDLIILKWNPYAYIIFIYPQEKYRTIFRQD